MAPTVKPTSQKAPTPTRSRLQTISQDFADLDEQIRQAAHIIGLPDDWTSINEKEARSDTIRRLVCARADWVLRWILDKLKDETEAGKAARANTSAWQILDWMVHVLPISRSAAHLRDAGLPTILERTLFESLEGGSPARTDGPDIETQDASESSETVQEGSTPSRKRKRGAVDHLASKCAVTGRTAFSQLFPVLRAALLSITTLATSNSKSDDTTQTELMRMSLRTESAQASRILSFWFSGVNRLTGSNDAVTSSTNSDKHLDLSLVLEIWEARSIDASDETGASVEEFSTECLVATLTLLDTLKTLRAQDLKRVSFSTVDRAVQALDKLLVRHLFAPSRATFFADTNPVTHSGSNTRDAKALASSLEPLRAKLLQAAQIEDAGDPLPTQLATLFSAIPHLLDLAIRASPSRTPKGRLVEKPWIQATFSALAECSGCSLDVPPKFVARNTAVTALGDSLRVLQAHSVSISSELLKKVFWFHCGVKYPERLKRKVHWPLIASLIELDPSMFVVEPKFNSSTSLEVKVDLGEFVFDEVSVAESEGFGCVEPTSGFSRSKTDFADIDNKETSSLRRTVILEQIIVPLMVAFVQNRNLLGFLRQWDHQLVRSYRYENRKALKEIDKPIWEDRTLNKALAELFEISLTKGQIAALVEDHSKRIIQLGNAMETGSKENVNIKRLTAYKQASSSAVLVSAILQSIQSEDTIEVLQPHLHSLLTSYTTRVQDDRYSLYTRLSLSWFTLCQLLEKLWPIELHNSPEIQGSLLHPLIEQATRDLSKSKEERTSRRVDSLTIAAAMLFILDTCTYVHALPGSEIIIPTSLAAVTQCLSSSQLEPKEHRKMIHIFCAYFVTLLGHLSVDACRDSLLAMIALLSSLDNAIGDYIYNELSDSIIKEGNPLLQDAYYKALLKSLQQQDKKRFHDTALEAILHIDPVALLRETREATLDQLADLLQFGHDDARKLLSVMTHLLQIPNATAKICTDSNLIINIAEKLHKQKFESPSILQLLRLLLQSTLGHLIPNQFQTQSKTFLEEFTTKLGSTTKRAKQCSAAMLSVLRAVAQVQKQAKLLDLEQYVKLLRYSLTDSNSDSSASRLEVLDAFVELPSSAIIENKLFESTQAWLISWINDSSDLDSYLASTEQSTIEQAEYMARLYSIMGKFKIFPGTKWLIRFTLKVLSEPLSGVVQDTVYETIKKTLAVLSTSEKLDLVPFLTGVQDTSDQAASYRILTGLITTLDDSIEEDTELKQQQLALLPLISVLLAKSPDYERYDALLSSINIILDNKPSLASQYSIECVLSVLVRFTSRSSPTLNPQDASSIFSTLCETTRLILLIHRGRLGGRFHILLPLLQGLLFCLFIPNASRSGALPAWLCTMTPTDPIRLTPVNATQYSRLLITLCSPPQSSITKAHQHAHRKSKDLSDPVRAAREKTSSFLYPLLASFCRFQLNGRLEPGVREKLMPGLWEVVGTAGLHREVLDAMFAGLGRSERDVWRGLWSEWEGVNGRKQSVITE